MAGGLSFNPFALGNASGTFGVSSDGYYCGVTMDDPAVRYQLSGGVLATTEVLPMWGGVAITDYVAGVAGGPDATLGPMIARATGLASATQPFRGFSVFNQAHHAITSSASNCPIILPGTTVEFYRQGSRARIAVPCSPALASLRGQPSGGDISWDFVNQIAVPAQAAYAANVLTAATWSAANGGQATFTTTTASGVAAGSPVTISGMTPAGYNGTFTAAAGTTGSTIVVPLATNPGTATAFGSLAAGGGILPVNVLKFNVGNSVAPVYSAATGYCNWNFQASAVLLELV